MSRHAYCLAYNQTSSKLLRLETSSLVYYMVRPSGQSPRADMKFFRERCGLDRVIPKVSGMSLKISNC